MGRRYPHYPGSFAVVYVILFAFACTYWGTCRAPWYVSLYLAAINIGSLVAFFVDKSRAKRGEWRIPEVRLHLLTLAGGVLGSGAGMFFARHKIRNLGFHAMYFLGIVTFCGIASAMAPAQPEAASAQASSTGSSSAKAHKTHAHTRHLAAQHGA